MPDDSIKPDTFGGMWRVWMAFSFVPAMWAAWPPTGIDLAKLPHPALKPVRAGRLKAGETAAFDAITMTAGDSEVKLAGRGKSGKAWTAHLCPTCADRVWRGDLDGNGIPDYVLAGAGPYRSDARLAPAGALSILLMDADGMPMPFFSPIYFNEGEEAIQHLVTVEGQTRLLRQAFDEIPWNARLDWGCSGHWVTQMYRFQNGFVEEVRGSALGKRFPYVYNWAFGDDPECEHHPIGAAQGPKIRELGGATRVPAECPQVVADVLVLDSNAGREVEFPSSKGALAGRMAGAEVEVRGLQECAGAVMWGRAPH